MNDRQKCDLINSIRQKFADKNGIDFVIYPCNLEGSCPQDCPKMASELEYLEGEIRRIQGEGKSINLEGVFALDLSESTQNPAPLFDAPKVKNPEKMEELLNNPELSGLPPRYLDSLLD